MRISFELRGQKAKRASCKRAPGAPMQLQSPIAVPKHVPKRPWRQIVDAVASGSLARPCTSSVQPPESLVRALVNPTLGVTRHGLPLDALPAFASSVVVFLFRNGFLCRGVARAEAVNGHAQAYDSASSAFLLALDSGVIPAGLTTLMPCIFYDNCILVDIWDYRGDESALVPTSSAMLPRDAPSDIRTRRLVLRESPSHCMLHLQRFVEASVPGAPAGLAIDLEAALLPHVHPDDTLCWDPSPDVFQVAAALGLSSHVGQAAMMRRWGIGTARQYASLGAGSTPFTATTTGSLGGGPVAKPPSSSKSSAAAKEEEGPFSTARIAVARPILPPSASFLAAATQLRTGLVATYEANLARLVAPRADDDDDVPRRS
ncbi:hypothetical protein SDRG_07710 [Saprolegnia diclina VS20]|uniref:Spt20-like SEP domain-containing protein n=1 Tax=Saprolegnia diclina (strain VS20) TaxID=1156394 RepID=T0QJL8_SAPDV|nr:hypothetical protein SDRG_07710 [Saprolegnia diclina VS20]EQC34911.1 hypothetical protein SDRG_07710 [Saprolegnia diclina VS20]|eukprot:XP_008611783.1 hypothetical protein SDRG_07710 [Saprolegnia diclina VS20]